MCTRLEGPQQRGLFMYQGALYMSELSSGKQYQVDNRQSGHQGRQ
jgi:hypothetical protein